MIVLATEAAPDIGGNALKFLFAASSDLIINALDTPTIILDITKQFIAGLDSYLDGPFELTERLLRTIDSNTWASVIYALTNPTSIATGLSAHQPEIWTDPPLVELKATIGQHPILS